MLACLFQVGPSWSQRAPVRRALIPTKRTNTGDVRDVNSSVGPGKSFPSDIDDRIHNALLEELCADFGVTDSSDIDFLSFDVPTDRVQSGQLPADLEELGEIVSFGTVKPKTESVYSVSRGIRQTSSSTSHLSLLEPGVTVTKATSGMQMNIPDDVASPTISSSCEESKPADGGGEGLSDFQPNVHSTTGCVSVKPDVETSGSTEDNLKQLSDKPASVVETNPKQSIPPSAQIPEEQSEAISQSKNQLDGDSSTASSPRHVAKRARVIASGGDLLEDVKKSYAFVCGADIFTPPALPAQSHPRLRTPVGSQFEPVPYSQNVPSYGMRASFTDGCENSFQYGMQNSSSGQPLVPHKSYDTVPVNFERSTTPVKGFRQNYYSEWQTSPSSSSGLDRLYRPNIVHRANVVGSGAIDTRPDTGQFGQGYYSGTGTGPDICGSLPYAGGGQYRRTADFPGHIDQNNLSCQSLNSSPHPAEQSGRSYGYPLNSYGRSYQLVGPQSGPQQNEFYYSPLGSTHRSLPLHTSDARLQRGSVTANDSRNVYPSRHLYPAQPANTNSANYNEQGDRSLAASPVHYSGRSTTPGFPNYPFQSGMENNVRESDSGTRRYTRQEPAAAAGRMIEFGLQRAPIASGIQNGENFPSVPTRNEFTYNQANTGGDMRAEQRGHFPRSPAADRSVVNPMTARGAVMPSDAEQSYGSSSSLPAGQSLPSSCHSFVRHLIGSGSGPYRSHPLFPLLRDLVIADMNFEAPSFPYPLIAGLPKSFDRLISNYFSCTAHSANSASVDPSVDAIVMDALRYAHSALLGNCALQPC